MDISVITNIVLCVLSFVLAAISVVTVVITLRQNHQMIESSTRPYLTIYCASTYIQDIHHYLILKNNGASSATIIEFSSSLDLSKIAYRQLLKATPFKSIVGASLSPGQKILYPIDGKNISDQKFMTFKLSYRSDSGHVYNETIQVNVEYLNNVYSVRALTENHELKAISFSLQDIAEKML